MSRQTGSDQILLTQRLRLRPLSEDDAPVLYRVLSNPGVMKWTPSGPVQSVEEAREWIHTRALGRNTFHFVIEPLESNEYQNDCIGTIGCYGPPYVGYLIHPQSANQGFATEALRAILPGFFAILDKEQSSGSLDNTYIEARTMSENVASQRVLLKCGFQLWNETPQETQQTGSAPALIKTYRLAKADAVM